MTNDFTELINSPTPVLIDFTAVWCEPCKKQANELKKLIENYEEDELIIMQIDIDKNAKLSRSLKVEQVPTLMLYQNGKMLWRKTGGEWADVLQRIIREKVIL
jgi:thioredoxin 1